MDDITVAKMELADYKRNAIQCSIQELINAVNQFTISLDTQLGCAVDIKKLDILTQCLVKRVAPVPELSETAPPENINGTIISEKV